MKWCRTVLASSLTAISCMALHGGGDITVPCCETSRGMFSYKVKGGLRGDLLRFDIPFEANLAYADGLSFEFRCSSAKQLMRRKVNVYLAGVHGMDKGAYKLAFSPERPTGWTKIHLRKSMMTDREGTPGGLRSSAGFQLSIYREEESDFTLEVRNIRVLAVSKGPSVAILLREDGFGREGFSTISNDEIRFLQNLTKGFDALGIPSYWLSDHDLVCNPLPAKTKLVVLDGSSALPDGALANLSIFMSRGGKLLLRRPVEDKALAELTKNIPVVPQIKAEWALLYGNLAMANELVEHLKTLNSDMANIAKRSLASLRADEARDDDWAAAQTSGIGAKRRILVCHLPTGARGGSCTNWNSVADITSRSGLTEVMVCCSWGDYAAYDSKLLKPWPGLGGRNCLGECIAACHEKGLKVRAWRCCWTTPKRLADAEDIRERRDAGRMMIRSDGSEREENGCPTHPENIRIEIEAMAELAMSGADAVDFDYIRYPDEDGCFCARCRKLFESRMGYQFENWPQDVMKDKSLTGKWEEFRADNISQVVRVASERIRRIAPHVQIGASTCPDREVAYRDVGQDWARWSRQGWVDMLGMMNYTEKIEFFKHWLKNQRAVNIGKAELSVDIGTTCWQFAGDDAGRTVRFIKAAREAGFDGWSLFEADERVERILPILGQGLKKTNKEKEKTYE